MFLFIFVSFKQPLYKVRTALLCKGSADFLIIFKRNIDFKTNVNIAIMPASHIPHNRTPTREGISLLTDSAKSSICAVVSKICRLAAVPFIGYALGNDAYLNTPSREKNWKKAIGRKGINGIKRSPSSRNHKLNCIRPVKLRFNIRFAIRNKPMITQIRRLHKKKRIPKSAMSAFLPALTGAQIKIKIRVRKHSLPRKSKFSC